MLDWCDAMDIQWRDKLGEGYRELIEFIVTMTCFIP